VPAAWLCGAIGGQTGAPLEVLWSEDPRPAGTASGNRLAPSRLLGGSLLPVEVKATSRPRLGDAAHLRTFRAEYGRKARAGLLLHTGDATRWLAPDVLAVPWWRVL